MSKKNIVVFIFYFLVIYCTNSAVAQSHALTDSTYFFSDTRDNKSYKVIVLDGRAWMAEPMRYKTSNSWCYGGKKKNCKLYGRMYTWGDAQIACPQGWQLPSNEEWESLITYLGGDKKAGNFFAARDTSTFYLTFGYPPNIYGRFADDANELHFWSTTQFNDNTAWHYFIIKDKLPLISSSYISKNYHLNCLCVKNDDSVMNEEK
ncbi:MAG: hypothetical protein H7Y00_09435 [Fimbriimonadaceae bacterium]|nr:hypothetical protein [Chitinophagales bacterium]